MFLLLNACAAVAEETLSASTAHQLLDDGKVEAAEQLLVRLLAHSDVPTERDDQETLSAFRARVRLLGMTGQFDKGLSLSKILQEILVGRFGASHRESLANARLMADLLTDIGDPNSALQILRDAASAARQADLPDGIAVLTMDAALVQQLGVTGNRGAAASLALDVWTRAQRAALEPVNRERIEFLVVDGLRLAGYFEEANWRAQQIFVRRLQRFGPDHVLTLMAMSNLASISTGVGRTDLAVELFEDLLGRTRRGLGLHHALTLHSWHALGYALLLNGERERARDELSKLLAALAGRFGGADARATDAAADLIRAAYQLGDTAACAATAPFVQAYLATSPPEHDHARMEALHGLALCRHLAGQPAEAVHYLTLELEARRRAVGHQHWRTLDAQRVLGAVLLDAGDMARARQVLQEFVEGSERVRSESALAWRTRFADWVESRQHEAGYRSLIELLARDGAADEAWRIAELAKGRVLLDSEFVTQVKRNASPTLRRQIAVVQSELRNAELNLALANNPIAQVAATRAIDKSQRDLVELSRSVTSSSGIEATPVLESDQVFVQLVLAGERLVVLIREGAHGPKVAGVVEAGSASILVNAARRALGAEDGPGRLWRRADGKLFESLTRPNEVVERLRDEDALHRLAHAVLAPLRPYLHSGARLIISPDGAMAMFPFEALPWRGEPLGNRVQVSYAHSYASFALARSRLRRFAKPDRDELLLVGVKQPAIAEGIDKRLAALQWNPLPGVVSELTSIARIYAGKRIATLRDEAATESAFRALDRRLGRFRFIHFAAHAWFSDGSPDLSALVLGDPKGGDPTAGYLTAAEFRGLQLNSDLVVLSACSSAGAGSRAGEGLVGLVHAILTAGSAGAVVSLWEVGDTATAELMRVFYRGLRSGKTPATALTQAKRTLASRGYAARDWAAFVLYGAG